MSDFNLDNSRWYCLMSLGLASRNARVCAETIIDRSRKLGRYEYEPTAGTELAKTETALTEALLAVKLARAEYEQNTKPAMTAAE